MWGHSFDVLLSCGIFQLSDCHHPGSFGRPQSPGTSEDLGVSTTKAKQRSLIVNFVRRFDGTLSEETTLQG